MPLAPVASFANDDSRNSRCAQTAEAEEREQTRRRDSLSLSLSPLEEKNGT